MSDLTGAVAKIVSDEELVLNIGSRDGLSVGDIVEILDAATFNIKDPITGENLGSIPRRKALGKVYQVAERLALVRDQSPAGVASWLNLSGTSLASSFSDPAWRSGVKVGDPVRVRPRSS